MSHPLTSSDTARLRTLLHLQGISEPLLITAFADSPWTAIHQTIQLLAVCTESQAPCMKCKECRTTLTGHHQQLYTIAPEDAPFISIADIRHLREVVNVRPPGDRRFVFIPRAERLLTQAAGALLKELEEATVFNRYVLTTAYKGRLLPTILSRVMHVRLHLPLTQESEKVMSFDVDTLLFSKEKDTKEPLAEEHLKRISRYLQACMRAGQPGPDVRRSLMRLRDYYKIRAARGNERLAQEVLLASLLNLRNTAK
ncbi:MAG: hypothetical protein ACRD4B_10040 [Acidobacteriota bacterium]